MPKIQGKKFAYSPAGKQAAKEYEERLKQKKASNKKK